MTTTCSYATGFGRILDDSGDFQVVGEAGDAATGIELAAALQPALVLMDISLPRVSGIAAIPPIREGFVTA